MPEARLERTRKSYEPSMRDIYNAVSAGDGVPDLAIMNGGNLNQMLDTTEYWPDEVYAVSKQGIVRIDR